MSTAQLSPEAIEGYVFQLQGSRDFFKRSISVLTEEHSGYRPTEELMSVAGQILHTALSVEWFLEGAFSPDGFEMGFEEHAREVEACASLEAATQRLDEAYAKIIDKLRAEDPSSWMQPLPEGEVMGGAPRISIVHGIVDHSAHHRGALTVYARTLGLVPLMPYM